MLKGKLFLFISIFIFSVSINAQERLVANLSSHQVVPATSSAGSGVCRMALYPMLPELACSFSNLTGGLTSARLFVGGVGMNGAQFITHAVSGSPQNGQVVFTFFAYPAEFSQLHANQIYISLITSAFPNGEIRGQFHVANSAYNDFDGDGRTDLTVYRNSNNSFYTLGSSSGILTEKQLGQPGDSVSLTVDFDGDGRSDFSTARYNAEVLWRIFKSSTYSLEETRWGSSSLGDFFAAADYDGDGAFDIAVFRAGVWYVLESSTGNVRYQYFGQSGDVPAPNDFDKDGKADLAVARSENGQRVWHVQRSSDGAYYGLQWGLSSDAFFTGRADWDGDGAADISVIRNQGGQRVFYILRSSDRQMQVIYWGLSSDVVKLGDYDGDGKTDAAITRAVNGQRVFYILPSSTGEPRYETFGLAGDF